MRFLVFLLIVGLTVSYSQRGDAVTPALRSADTAARARAVDQNARDTLGIGVRSLAMLLGASEYAFQPKWAVEKNGSWDRLQQLAAKGYITISSTKGLPDGSNADQEFISYVATEKGRAIIDAFGTD